MEDSVNQTIQKLAEGASDAAFGIYSAAYSLQLMMKAAARDNDPEGIQILPLLDLLGIYGDDIGILMYTKVILKRPLNSSGNARSA